MAMAGGEMSGNKLGHYGVDIEGPLWWWHGHVSGVKNGNSSILLYHISVVVAWGGRERWVHGHGGERDVWE